MGGNGQPGGPWRRNKWLRAKGSSLRGSGTRNGASEGIRTLDTHVGNVMLYQAELRSLPSRRGYVSGVLLNCKGLLRIFGSRRTDAGQEIFTWRSVRAKMVITSMRPAGMSFFVL